MPEAVVSFWFIDPRPDGSRAVFGPQARTPEECLHLVAAGGLLDEDPELALQHARTARDRASRIAVVREAVGVAAYHASDFAEA